MAKQKLTEAEIREVLGFDPAAKYAEYMRLLDKEIALAEAVVAHAEGQGTKPSADRQHDTHSAIGRARDNLRALHEARLELCETLMPYVWSKATSKHDVTGTQDITVEVLQFGKSGDAKG